ncbi:hypothetical protein MRX96_013354 [Rhipicephalus microplus]
MASEQSQRPQTLRYQSNTTFPHRSKCIVGARRANAAGATATEFPVGSHGDSERPRLAVTVTARVGCRNTRLSDHRSI